MKAKNSTADIGSEGSLEDGHASDTGTNRFNNEAGAGMGDTIQEAKADTLSDKHSRVKEVC